LPFAYARTDINLSKPMGQAIEDLKQSMGLANLEKKWSEENLGEVPIPAFTFRTTYDMFIGIITRFKIFQ